METQEHDTFLGHNHGRNYLVLGSLDIRNLLRWSSTFFPEAISPPLNPARACQLTRLTSQVALDIFYLCLPRAGSIGILPQPLCIQVGSGTLWYRADFAIVGLETLLGVDFIRV